MVREIARTAVSAPSLFSGTGSARASSDESATHPLKLAEAAGRAEDVSDVLTSLNTDQRARLMRQRAVIESRLSDFGVPAA